MGDVRGYSTVILMSDPTGLVVEYRQPDDMQKFLYPHLHFGDPCWHAIGRIGIMPPNIEVWPLPDWWPGYAELKAQDELYKRHPGVSYYDGWHREDE